MVSPARDVALDVLLAVHERGAYGNLMLDAVLSEASIAPRDAALATELAYGTLRAQGTLDWAIGQFSTRDQSDLSPVLLDVLRLAAYQIMYLDIPDHAAVNEAVNQARGRLHQGAGAFANAVLRALAARSDELEWPSREDDLESCVSLRDWHPLWLVRKWFDELGAETTEQLCIADNVPPVVSLRVNVLRASRDEILEALRAREIDAGEGVLMPEAVRLKRAGSLTALDEHASGLVYAQDEASMAVAHVVDPQPGETILDLCAAPGGKATHLAELMANEGRVVALDVNASRLGLVRQAADRLGVGIVETVQADARAWRPAGQFDRVLLDAPCSSLGVLARRAEARWRRSEQDIAGLVKLQAELLNSAVSLVKSGGILVYSTCTISEPENQAQVAAFLERHGEFEPGDPDRGVDGEVRSGPGWIQFMPHVNGTDGIFVAKLARA